MQEVFPPNHALQVVSIMSAEVPLYHNVVSRRCSLSPALVPPFLRQLNIQNWFLVHMHRKQSKCFPPESQRCLHVAISASAWPGCRPHLPAHTTPRLQGCVQVILIWVKSLCLFLFIEAIRTVLCLTPEVRQSTEAPSPQPNLNPQQPQLNCMANSQFLFILFLYWLIILQTTCLKATSTVHCFCTHSAADYICVSHTSVYIIATPLKSSTVSLTSTQKN